MDSAQYRSARTITRRRLLATSLLPLLSPALFAEPSAKTPPPFVVLVHGFWDTGEVFAPLEKALNARGIETLAPTLEPRDGRKGLEDLAKKLSQQIDDKAGPNRKIHLVGFSMGSLVSRYYIQRLGGKHRTLHFFSISGPHHGTRTAPLYPAESTRQMAPGSPFLKDLNDDWNTKLPVPTTSFWTSADLLIIPPKSSILPEANNQEIDCLLHPLMVRNKVVIKTIIDTIIPPSP